MATETSCQTDGVVYHTHISNNQILVNVELHKLLNLTKEQAEVLDANIHNALELVLAPYFMEDYYNSQMSYCRLCREPMFKPELNQYEECAECERNSNG